MECKQEVGQKYWKNMFDTVKVYLLMVIMQFGSAGMYIISMSTLDNGMLSRYVFIAYRNAMAAIALAPFALFLERKVRPKMTLSIFLKIVLLGFLEIILDQEFAFLGMMYTSASYTSAILNAVPSFTFLLACIFGLERLQIKKRRSQAKVFGTVITFGGAVLMALYKGPAVNIFGSWHSKHHESSINSSTEHWILGTGALLIACVAFSMFYILQCKVLKEYPAPMSLSSLICFVGTIQGGAVAVAVDHHPRAWALGWDATLFAPLYSGVVTTGLLFYVQGEVMRTRGPVFVTAFNPLRMIIVALMAVAILGEKLYFGSIIGSAIVVIGLYAVMWGKAKDHRISSVEESEAETTLPISMQPKGNQADVEETQRPKQSSDQTDRATATNTTAPEK